MPKENNPDITPLLDMQLIVEPSPDRNWILKVITGQSAEVPFLELKADGSGFSIPESVGNPPVGKDDYFELLDRLGFRLKTGHLFREGQQVFWLHTSGFGWDDDEMEDKGLFLYFNSQGQPQTWEVK